MLVPRTRTKPAARRLRILAWGTAWGVAMTVVEQLAFTPGEAWATVKMVLWWLTVWLTPLWCVVGCLFAWTAERSVGRKAFFISLSGWLIVAATSSIAQPFLSHSIQTWVRESHPGVMAVIMGGAVQMPLHPPAVPLMVYNLWINLFYGGLLMMAYSLTRRRERMRSLLHATAVARHRTQTMLDEARLQTLQRQVDPALLLSAMGELEQRYRDEPDRAERLLETLVEFLRCAMPGLREPISTVNLELRLARAYVKLQRERGFGAGWSIEESNNEILDARFPSLLMLPLLSLGADGADSLLTTRVANGRVMLTLRGLAREASFEFVHVLRTRLQSLYGESFTVQQDSSTNAQLEITLLAEPTAGSMS